MDRLSHRLKRADHRMNAYQRLLLAPFGITPARYTMLYAIFHKGMDLGAKRRVLDQSDLRRALGVTAPTVSVMVRSLEELGLVERRKWIASDKRQVMVILTLKAMRLLRRIDRRIIRPGILWIAARTLLGGADKLGAVLWWLSKLCVGLRDSATFEYRPNLRTLFPERRWKPPAPFVWPGKEPAPVSLF
jgi:DNA-binding MarR family transcriptional regulator